MFALIFVTYINCAPVRSKSSVLCLPHNVWQSLPHSRCSITLLTFGKIISPKKCQKKCLENYTKTVIFVKLFAASERIKENLKRNFCNYSGNTFQAFIIGQILCLIPSGCSNAKGMLSLLKAFLGTDM